MGIPSGLLGLSTDVGRFESEHPPHRVTLKSFLICRTECTQAAWDRIGGRDSRDNNPLAGIIALVSIIIAPIAAMLIRFAISRSREYEADRSGAEISGNPLALARALQKLEQGTSRIPMEVNPSTAQLFIADPLKAFGNRGGRSQGSSLGCKLCEARYAKCLEYYKCTPTPRRPFAPSLLRSRLSRLLPRATPR